MAIPYLAICFYKFRFLLCFYRERGETLVQEIFNRREYKYIINKETYSKMIPILMEYFALDKNGKNSNGIYTIGNIYYDTEDELFNSEFMRKQTFRQKLRLRFYDKVDLDSTVFLEIKKKFKGIVYKRRTGVKLEDAYKLLQNNNEYIDLESFPCTNTQILKEVYFFFNQYKMIPKAILSYDRQAFHCIDNMDLRITFDMNLRCRVHDLRIENGNDGEPFVSTDTIIFEVKSRDSVPVWLCTILSNFECYKGSFSKYLVSCEVRKELQNKNHEENKIKF